MLCHWPSGYREGIKWRCDSAWSGKEKQEYASVDIPSIEGMSWKYMPWCRSLWYNHTLCLSDEREKMNLSYKKDENYVNKGDKLVIIVQ